MATFRVLDQFPQYTDAQGAILAGGYLAFYETNTTTPKDVYADPDMAVNNGPAVDLDSSGRTDVDVWGNGVYRVRLYDADDVLVAERDDVEIPGGEATALPALEDGKFLTNDGSVMLWEDILQVPDPTGSTEHILGTDGTNVMWRSASAILDILGLETTSVTTNSLWVGSTLIQWGASAFPVPVVIPHHGAIKAVTFPEAFETTPIVLVCANKNQIASSGFKAVCSAEPSLTGFTAEYNTNENTTDPGSEVNIEVAFSWIAIGTAEQS